jgi:hypothetical protein
VNFVEPQFATSVSSSPHSCSILRIIKNKMRDKNTKGMDKGVFVLKSVQGIRSGFGSS